MRNLKTTLLILVLSLLLIGCSKPLKESAFCLSSSVNTYERSGGPSTPVEFKQVLDNQTIQITYIAQWDAGKVSFEIWDINGIPIWSADAQKTTTPLTLTSAPLKTGSYRLVNTADDATNGTICMSATLK